jgi:alpha-ribazole phosphatase/probable phosphoglycerate mutase
VQNVRATTRLLLVRHAEPQAQARGRCYGTLDIGLSDEGHRQADRLARSLAQVGLTAVYTSPRRRSLQTAGALGRVHGLVPIVDERLSEIDFGDFEGRTYEEIEREHPSLFRRWMETPTEVEFPNGESYERFKARALLALASILEHHRRDTVAVVSHGGIARAILADCLSIPNAGIFRIDQSYGAISIVDWIDGVPIVRLLNGDAAGMLAR